MILTREKMLEQVKKYTKQNNKELIEYYYSLINLEENLLKNDTFDYELVSKSKIFPSIAKYNIYMNLLNLYDEIQNTFYGELQICEDETKENLIFEGYYYPTEQEFNLASFERTNSLRFEILLYQLIIDRNYRKKLYYSEKETLEKEKKSKNFKYFNVLSKRALAKKEGEINSIILREESDEIHYQEEIQEKFVKEFEKKFNVSNYEFVSESSGILTLKSEKSKKLINIQKKITYY